MLNMFAASVLLSILKFIGMMPLDWWLISIPAIIVAGVFTVRAAAFIIVMTVILFSLENCLDDE